MRGSLKSISSLVVVLFLAVLSSNCRPKVTGIEPSERARQEGWALRLVGSSERDLIGLSDPGILRPAGGNTLLDVIVEVEASKTEHSFPLDALELFRGNDKYSVQASTYEIGGTAGRFMGHSDRFQKVEYHAAGGEILCTVIDLPEARAGVVAFFGKPGVHRFHLIYEVPKRSWAGLRMRLRDSQAAPLRTGRATSDRRSC